MATGYSIEIGYISGYSSRDEQGEMWERLRGYANALSQRPETILEEAKKFWSHENTSALEEVCKTYPLAMEKGGPMHTTPDDDEDDNKLGKVFISTSGSGRYREAKEHAARAFCRLCLLEMHSHGIEICINVG